MIPVLTTMVGLLILLVAMDVIARDQERGGDGMNMMSFVAGLIVIAGFAGTAYVWRLSMEATQQMEEASRQVEQIRQLFP